MSAHEIDYVNAHGSSTPLNDATETLAIKKVLGDHAYRIPVSGTKGYYGHALGASGAIEAAICALALSREWLPPTVNLAVPDTGCDLDYIPRCGRPGGVRTRWARPARTCRRRWARGRTMGWSWASRSSAWRAATAPFQART